MKSHILPFLVASSLECGVWASSRNEVTPVQKVIELLNGMRSKGQLEKHEEQVQFAAYKQFCDDTTVEKQRDIKEAEERIEVLTADIAKYEATIDRLTQEIAAHDADIAAWEGDKEAAAKVRKLEKKDYDALHQDLSESVDALQRAIQVLEAQAHDRPQALIQVSALSKMSLIPDEAKRAIDLFLQGSEQSSAAPEAYGYEFQSQGIIEMLGKLLDKFIDERTVAEKKEANAKHAHELLVQDLTAQITQSTQDRDEKTARKATTQQKKVDAEAEKKDTTDAMEADKKYLASLTATCTQKAADFADRQQLRTEEIATINKAIEIISSNNVQGHANTYLPAFAQSSVALAQLRAGSSSSEPQQRVAEFLRGRGQELNSRVLSALAIRVANDPFAKVKKMIKDLIVRLMEEANEEADHKAWCDTELATNEQTRKEKTAAVESLHAEIDQLEASIALLTQQIADLRDAVAILDERMANATALRQAEKKTNLQTIKDSQEAQTAVAQALTVLKEFYERASEATALVQQQPVAPEIFDRPYQGMQSENGGVIGMLEVIESDFARLEAETKASEAASQQAYDRFMTESAEDKAAKEKDIEHKEVKKQDQEQSLTTNKQDLSDTQRELNAALAYFDKLKPSCIEAGVTYDSRVNRRKEEIESLQEALKILNGEVV